MVWRAPHELGNPEFSADSAIRKASWAKPMPPALSIVIKFFVGAKVARVGSLCRNPHLEHRPAALPVRGSHGAAVPFDDGLDDRESEAGVAVGGRVVGAVSEKTIEDAAEVFVEDARAFVGDSHDRNRAVARRGDRDLLSV